MKGTSVIHSLAVLFSSQKYLNTEILIPNYIAVQNKMSSSKKFELERDFAAGVLYVYQSLLTGDITVSHVGIFGL